MTHPTVDRISVCRTYLLSQDQPFMRLTQEWAQQGWVRSGRRRPKVHSFWSGEQLNCLNLYFLGQPSPSPGAQLLFQAMTQEFLYMPKEMWWNRIRTAKISWAMGVFCTILDHAGVLKEVAIHFTLFSC